MISHLVVDGSNIATEGRSLPSVEQLEQAVADLAADREIENIIVIVDATFPNRIDASESARYEQLLADGWLLTPPAGAIGRGDAFILQVAERVNAVVLSNDSFQEFHGSMQWLFDAGRLVGGKPVPSVGWVFVDRSPVRGPTSRRAVRDAKKAATDPPSKQQRADDEPATTPKKKRPARKKAAAAAPASETGAAPKRRRRSITAEPTAEPATEAAPADDVTTDRPDGEPTVVRRRTRRPAQEPVTPAAPAAEPVAEGSAEPKRRRRRVTAKPMMNEPTPFVAFVAENLPGSIVTATVTSFTSHGAYASVGEVTCYVPNRLLGDPPPRSAKQVVKIGEEVQLEVQSVDSTSRGIDLALPGLAGSSPSDMTTTGRDARVTEVTADMATKKKAPAKKAPAKKAPAKRPLRRRLPRRRPLRRRPLRRRPLRRRPLRRRPLRRRPLRRRPLRRRPLRRRPLRRRLLRRRLLRRRLLRRRLLRRRLPRRRPLRRRPLRRRPLRRRPLRRRPPRRRPQPAADVSVARRLVTARRARAGGQ